MVSPNLEVLERQIMAQGPSKVVVSRDGDTTSSARARGDYGIIPDIIFIRADGWSLGAPKEWESIAYDTWPDEWVGFIRRSELIAKRIQIYEEETYGTWC